MVCVVTDIPILFDPCMITDFRPCVAIIRESALLSESGDVLEGRPGTLLHRGSAAVAVQVTRPLATAVRTLPAATIHSGNQAGGSNLPLRQLVVAILLASLTRTVVPPLLLGHYSFLSVAVIRLG